MQAWSPLDATLTWRVQQKKEAVTFSVRGFNKALKIKLVSVYQRVEIRPQFAVHTKGCKRGGTGNDGQDPWQNEQTPRQEVWWRASALCRFGLRSAGVARALTTPFQVLFPAPHLQAEIHLSWRERR